MKSSARLDSVIFQLTPTRTRCDLVITANGKTEKIASGLLNPFLAHLKTAQDQIATGGYSILLEPGSNTTWFTKGTVERFVRFVSTPEILERVHTIESEILQIEKAIAIQGNNDMGLSTEEDCQPKPVGNIEGSKIITDANEQKAIVLYKPDVHPPEANGSRPQEGNSKVQLLKVLETRKTVLQKEQGMAFARAVAAGFDIDEMSSLVSFSECFGASRLMDACLRFMDLWKGKHETGQWLEIEAVEAMSSRSEFSAMNASGIMLSGVANKQNESHGDSAAENIGKTGIDTSTDERHPMDHQVPAGQQEYFQGQFPHPMFPPWPAHYPPGAFPVFPQYPVQVPYYQNYPGNGPFYQPPYPPTEDSQLNVARRAGQRRNSVDGGDGNTESEEQGDLELEKEASPSQGPRKKAGKSSKKQSGVVVIRNINYIASKGQNSSGSESQSASDSEIDKESGDMQASAPETIKKNSLPSKRIGIHTKFMDESNSYDMVETISGKGADGERWQAFQNFLLKDTDERNHGADQDMFVSEKNVQIRRQQNALGDDPIAFGGQDLVQLQDARITEFHKISGNATRMLRPSNDEVLLSRREGDYGNGRGSTDDQMDLQSTELNERKVVRRRNENDDFMIVGRENQSHLVSSADPLAINGFMQATNNFGRSSQQDMTDESFIVPFRSISLDQVGPNDRTVIDMDSEFPSTDQKSENSSNRVGNQVNYEPDDLSLMPERGLEKRTIGYDPALEYKMQIHAGEDAALDNRNKEVVADVTQGPKKSDKGRKSKVAPDALDKKKTVGPIRKGKPSKMSPLDDARARAERLRTYKADLQKMKKEKEEEERKRLEALKIERQKRIAARGSSTTAQSPSSQQTRKQLPTKLSLSSQRGSRFSDLEPGSLSPLQRSKLQTASLGSSESQKSSKTSKSGNVSHLPGNSLTRSVSSLPEQRKESSGDTPNTRASMTRIRRLSEPKTSSSPYVAPMKMRSAELLSKPKVSNEPESKKIAAIINLDRSKAATLPELKIRTSRGPSDVGRNKSAAKETSHRVNGKKSSVSSGSNNDKNTHQSDLDDNPVIDKTVVMLECEKPCVPVLHASEENIGAQKEHFDNQDEIENTEMISGYAAIRAPASPMDRVDIEPVQCQLQEQSRSYVVTTSSSYAEKEPLESSNICVDEKPYQAPYARLSSLEDSCTENSEYGKAPSMGLDTTTMDVETAKTQVSVYENLKLEKIPEVLEKPQVKESAKGFKRLLKFGRKNHSSAAGDQSLELDNGSINSSEVDDSSTNAASASEVHTLKNLISQDETPITGTASQKYSRHFSLLSPFRSKTSEKKSTT